MISKADIEALVHQGEKLDSRILSVYLDIDQSRSSNRNREFESTLKTLLRQIETGLPEERDGLEEFAQDAKMVKSFLRDYKPMGLGLVVFCSQSSNFFWHRDLHIPVRNEAHWDTSIFVRPLLEALDEHERYGVILIDRGRARLFTHHLGEIEEHRGVFSAAEVRRTKTIGTDHWRSQTRQQRKADEHARSHAKHVADSMNRVDGSYSFDRLVLAGPVEARTELQHLLPKRLHRKVIASITLPMDATQDDVLEATREIELKVERDEELKLVDQLLTVAAKNQRAVTRLEPTLEALREGRVWQLIYAASYRPQGGECSQCGVLMSAANAGCPFCGGSVKPAEFLINRILERVSEGDGKVEVVGGEAAERLVKSADSIGAFLRF